MSFIKFQKISGKFSKLADFWPKKHHLALFCVAISKLFFDGNRIRAFKNFSDFMDLQSCRGGYFLVIFGPFFLIYNRLFWTDPKNLGGPIDLLSYVRPSVRPDGFRSNHSIVFSDFWHQGSFLWFQKTDEKGVKNMHF